MMRNIPLPVVSEETVAQIARTPQTRPRGLASAAGNVSRRDLETHWNEIADHKCFLSERLGRDVGTNVAALDYLSNIRPVPPESIWQRVGRILERTIEASGPNSIANLEIAMRNRRMW